MGEKGGCQRERREGVREGRDDRGREGEDGGMVGEEV